MAPFSIVLDHAGSILVASKAENDVEHENVCEKHDGQDTAGEFLDGQSVKQINGTLVRQVSLRLLWNKPNVQKELQTEILKKISQQRILAAQNVCCSGSLGLWNHEIRPSYRVPPVSPRMPAWELRTLDDFDLSPSQSLRSASFPTTLQEVFKLERDQNVRSFFLSRVSDPTSYFYRFHFDDSRHLVPRKMTVSLVNVKWLKPHEQIVSWERVNKLKKAILSWNAYTEPLLIDQQTGTILDGHHRYTVALQLELLQVPAVLVNYLQDEHITVDVWPGCGRQSLTKEQVVKMALSGSVFPPKTSRHRFSESLPPISVSLHVLQQQLTVAVVPMRDCTKVDYLDQNAQSQIMCESSQQTVARNPLRSQLNLHELSITLFCGAQSWASQVKKSLFINRIRKFENREEFNRADHRSLDLVKRPTLNTPTTSSFFDAIRVNDPTSSFCRQKAMTLEDLLSVDAAGRQKFYTTRICDPTSYFFKFHFDVSPKRQPKRVAIHLAKLSWLKEHEHVVSWSRVNGLRKATLRWDAYMEPLLVDLRTGAILDGHHRYHVGRQLNLATVPVVLVDYLKDNSITVDVWPNCGRDSLTKEEVIAMSLSSDVFPPKTSRHKFSDDLPPIRVSLERLREALPESEVVAVL